MMTCGTIARFVIAVNCLSVYALGQTLTPPSVQVTAAIKSHKGLYTYRYVIDSRAKSRPVWLVCLDLSLPPDSLTLKQSGLENGNGYDALDTSVVLNNPSSVLTVPVGLTAPDNWLVGVATEGSAHWFSEDVSTNLSPGTILNGLRVDSFGLAGIRSMKVSSPIDYASLPFDPPADPSDLPRYEADFDNLSASVTTNITTIGPTSPPQNFDSLKFLSQIFSYAYSAHALRWIKDDEILRGTLGRLSLAKAAIERGEVREAKVILRSLQQYLRERPEQVVSSEARGLLSTNISYLIFKISPGESCPEDEE